jgi:hypothetical protein
MLGRPGGDATLPHPLGSLHRPRRGQMACGQSNAQCRAKELARMPSIAREDHLEAPGRGRGGGRWREIRGAIHTPGGYRSPLTGLGSGIQLEHHQLGRKLVASSTTL